MILALAQSTAAVEQTRGSIDRLMNTPLFTIGQTPVTMMTVVTFALIGFATLWISRLAQRGTRRAFAMRGVSDTGTLGVATRLVNYAVILLGLGIGLQTIGIDLSALFAAGAFFAVALGFAMQNVAQNFISGVILVTERTIKPGDVLKVEGHVVRVTRMGLRATVARTRDEEDMIIPNATLVQNTVTNFTLRDHMYRLCTTVGVAYESDMRVVMQTLRDAAVAFPGRIATHEPSVLMTGFGASSVNFDVSVWLDDPWASRTSLSDLNSAIWWALKSAGIAIPYTAPDDVLLTPTDSPAPASAPNAS